MIFSGPKSKDTEYLGKYFLKEENKMSRSQQLSQ